MNHVDVVLQALFSLEPFVAQKAKVLFDSDVEPAYMIGQFSLELEPRRTKVTTFH